MSHNRRVAMNSNTIVSRAVLGDSRRRSCNFPDAQSVTADICALKGNGTKCWTTYCSFGLAAGSVKVTLVA